MHLPGPDWRWISKWEISHTGLVDAEGWEVRVARAGDARASSAPYAHDSDTTCARVPSVSVPFRFSLVRHWLGNGLWSRGPGNICAATKVGAAAHAHRKRKF